MTDKIASDKKISIIGLGYVGLPIACAFANKGRHVIGFDINKARIDELKSGIDRTNEVETDALKAPTLHLTNNLDDLRAASIHIITVPTPVTSDKQPDLQPVLSATRTIASVLKRGDIVVYESTVYPGVTEEECTPLLEEISGLKYNSDFTVGYSPERINPGDKLHRFETIVKVVSGSTPDTLNILSDLYASVVEAGIHKAPSIKVAEASKVIENIQRDVNIALMNELAIIFDKMDIRTQDVLTASATKWNFLNFKPGLVGGHCIGIDPYYMTAKAISLGYNPQMILSGRRINDSISNFIVTSLIKKLSHENNATMNNLRVGILGLTFKENVPDLRNSKVPDIASELQEYGIHTIVHDAMADKQEAFAEYAISLQELQDFKNLDALILAVPHAYYLKNIRHILSESLKGNAIIMDIKSALSPDDDALKNFHYWSL